MKLKLVFYIFLFFVSCKTSKNNSEVKEEKKKTETVIASDTHPQSNSNNYRFTISFFSRGNGTDGATIEKLNKFIKEYEEKNKVKLVCEITHWGKEGETDYCLKLSEINPKQQDQFVSDAKTLLQTSNIVTIAENTTCVHKK